MLNLVRLCDNTIVKHTTVCYIYNISTVCYKEQNEQGEKIMSNRQLNINKTFFSIIKNTIFEFDAAVGVVTVGADELHSLNSVLQEALENIEGNEQNGVYVIPSVDLMKLRVAEAMTMYISRRINNALDVEKLNELNDFYHSLYGEDELPALSTESFMTLSDELRSVNQVLHEILIDHDDFGGFNVEKVKLVMSYEGLMKLKTVASTIFNIYNRINHAILAINKRVDEIHDFTKNIEG